MKYYYFLILIIITLCFAYCEKQDAYNIDVETYIKLLKSGKYEEFELPPFTPLDIPALLEYRNDTLTITDFPHNGISSLYAPKCKLGVYVLWTIESIRAVYIKSEYLIGRFPSQNPILQQKNYYESALTTDATSHMTAAKAYNDWWWTGLILESKMEIDPLESTNYEWH